MSRDTRTLVAFLLAALIAFGATLPLWHEMHMNTVGAIVADFLLLFSLPGALVAFPLGYMGIGGNMHDPSVVVMGVVDFLFYWWLFHWLMTRRLPRGR